MLSFIKVFILNIDFSNKFLKIKLSDQNFAGISGLDKNQDFNP